MSKSEAVHDTMTARVVSWVFKRRYLITASNCFAVSWVCGQIIFDPGDPSHTDVDGSVMLAGALLLLVAANLGLVLMLWFWHRTKPGNEGKRPR